MATTVTQPTNDPTNKTTAAAAALAAWGMTVSIGSLALKNLAPEWYDPDMIIAVSAGVPVLIQFVTSWFSKDKPNVIVTQEAEQ
ncbi:hypothetical protein ACFX5Q_07315 [Mesorhizobium sp. IMUNJ 23033]|uniref:hypothetical protein n=1 Tax=Mesorhizobium sp. IMUNJ 23033 TaxID=3378039 RepID=UPI003850B7B0